MSLYAISDLHLSFADETKSMSKFGSQWENHHEKIKANWLNKISSEDTVLIAGDISWAMKTTNAMPDLSFINSLPGKKILTKGNHDYWWNSTNKLNSLYPDMIFLKDSFTTYKDYTICGIRGWLCPNDTYFTEKDEPHYQKAIIRTKNTILKAKDSNYDKNKIIILMHYAPTNDKKEPSGFTEIFYENNISTVIYGHLHDSSCFGASLLGFNGGTNYILTSCDYIDFCPVVIPL